MKSKMSKMIRKNHTTIYSKFCKVVRRQFLFVLSIAFIAIISIQINTGASKMETIVIAGQTSVNQAATRSRTINIGGNQIFTITQAEIGSNDEFKISPPEGSTHTWFGRNVAISGNTAVAVTPGSKGGFSGSRPVQAGAAYVFVRGSDGVWSQQAILTGNGDPRAFGSSSKNSVAIFGDTIIVGASSEDINSNVIQGAAYIFTRTGTTWTQQARLVPSDGATFDRFGESVSISGNTVIIGAPGYGPGASGTPSYPHTPGFAYVFVRNGSTWTQQQKLLASDGAIDDFFGGSVAISGETAIIGAFFDDVGTTTDKGSAYVYVRNGTIWTQQQKITSTNSLTNKLFGRSVGLDGNNAVVGENTGGFSNGDPGSAYIFTRSGTVWSQQQRITADDGLQRDLFGESVAISGYLVVVGADGDDIGNNSAQGSVYIFSGNGTTWTQRQKLTASDGAADDGFGSGVAVSGSNLIVGAYLDDNPASDKGSAYVFRVSNTPTAANVSVGGRITVRGRGLKNARITLINQNGEAQTVLSGQLGYYRFVNVEPGQSYTISILSKKYTFSQSQRVISINGDTDDINFVADN